MNSTPAAIIPIKIKMLNTFCPGKSVGFPPIISLSLAKAIKLPENVIPPIKIARKIVVIVRLSAEGLE